MRNLVFFLEEPSAKEMLKGMLPKLLPADVKVQYVVFEGKQDLEKRLPIRLRAWQQPDCLFVVMRDQDSGNCIEIKNNLVQKTFAAGKPNTLVRIACHELETFYLGDLSAVGRAIGPAKLSALQERAKFRNPDLLANPAQELKKIAPQYQKISGSRAIGPALDIDGNRSVSFNTLISGLCRLVG
jgi:hypothetical protein